MTDDAIPQDDVTPLEAAASALAEATRDAQMASRCAAVIRVEAGCPHDIAAAAAQAYAAAAQAWGAVAQAEATLFASTASGVQARALISAAERVKGDAT